MKMNLKKTENGKLSIELTCVVCHKVTVVEVFEKDYINYTKGRMFVQDCFPYLDADHREMFISGICPTCWDNMFGSDEEV